MRVFWMCNARLSETDVGTTGTWLSSLAYRLHAVGGVQLGVLAPGPVPVLTRSDCGGVAQWLTPSGRKCRDGLPSPAILQAIVETVTAFVPDIVHVWGTEMFWGLLTARGRLPFPALLEMQGVKGEIAKVYYGGLTLSERLRCIGAKEVLKRRTMADDRRAFANWGHFEHEMIRGHQFIDVQSQWVTAHVRAINPSARLFPIDLALRDPFYEAAGWQPAGHPTLFCSSAAHPPYKGLHTVVRVLSLLRQRIPQVRIRIAGMHQRRGLRQDGYICWLNRLARKLGVADAIDWLGPLDAGRMRLELRNAAAAVIPTYIENCCTSMQEVMAVGTPLAASSAGGLPSLAKDEESCLFFAPGDEAMCAMQLERLLTDPALAHRVSQCARTTAEARNDRARIVRRQAEIYAHVIGAGPGDTSA